MAKVKKSRVKIVKVSEENCSERVLGLDCSSSTLGWGLIGINEDKMALLSYGYFKPLKSDTALLVRLEDLYETIKGIIIDVHPTQIAIEDIIQYMAGASKASTIIILTAFNRIAAFSAYREAQIDVEFISVSTVRSEIKNYLKMKEKIDKDCMPEIIKNNLSNEFSFILNKKGAISEETYDMSDGIAVSWAKAIKIIRNGDNK